MAGAGMSSAQAKINAPSNKTDPRTSIGTEPRTAVACGRNGIWTRDMTLKLSQVITISYGHCCTG